jgi:hypothetical protein
MHQVDPTGVSPQVVRVNPAKSIGVKAFIQLPDGLVDLFLLRGDPALGIQ